MADAEDTIEDGEERGVDLDTGDAAIIIRTNGDIETILPIGPDDSDIRPGDPTMVAGILIYILTDEKRFAALQQEFIELCNKAKTEPEKLLH